MAKDDNIEILSGPKWTPEQALIAAQKKDDWHNIFIVGESEAGYATIAANCDAKTMLLLSEIIRKRAMSFMP